MLCSYKWLGELVDLGDMTPEECAEKLTSLGLEAAIVDDRRGRYKGFVVGHVAECVKHENADKLSIASVDLGDETKQIVCGAPNVRAGIDVVVAKIGATMPSGIKIEKRKVRGVLSEGMICSMAELELSGDHDGIMVLDDAPAPGTPFADQYEVDDTVLEIDLTPNRGDCASMIGIAREVSAITGGRLTLSSAEYKTSGEDINKSVSVEISAPDLCGRYSALLLRNVKVSESPFWMQRRLQALGLRSISNIVDVTNYILMETGHPLHAFDMRNIGGEKIIVRRAAAGEKFKTLDGAEHKLAPDNLLIADTGKGIALAGIMGGENSEVKPDTSDVLLESAWFEPSSIRKTGRMLSISSESSYRFERGSDIEGVKYAQERAALLMAEIAGGEIAPGRAESYPGRRDKHKVTVRPSRVSSIMGRVIEPEKIIAILKSLDMNPQESGDDLITVMAPFYRFDIEREIDLIEEIARHTGYENIKSRVPGIVVADRPVSPLSVTRSKITSALLGAGLDESVRYSFMSEADCDNLLLGQDHHFRNMVPIDNPISTEATHLRTSILPGMLGGINSNDLHESFEIGLVFEFAGDENIRPKERWMAGGIISGLLPPDPYTGRNGRHDFYDLKGVVEGVLAGIGYSRRFSFAPAEEPYYYPKRQANLLVDETIVGSIGEIHPTVLENFNIDSPAFVFDLDLDTLSSITPASPRYHKFSKFPAVKRDLAIVADESVPVQTIIDTIKNAGGENLLNVAVFDLFRSENIGADKKSVALSLSFGTDEKTLTDDEVDKAIETILDRLKTDLGAHLRP